MVGPKLESIIDFFWAVQREAGWVFKLQVRIDLPSSRIDSQIDSHLIPEGRTEIGIDNRFFFGLFKGGLSKYVRLLELQVRIDLPSNQIDSQIDSHLILHGRTEIRIDNLFFFGCWKVSAQSS